MDARMIITAIMAIALLSWVVFCAVKFFIHSKKVAAGINFVAHVKCEKCGVEYDVSAAECIQEPMVKSKSITRTKRKGFALAQEREYQSYAKKFHCPCCQEKCYAQITNISEIQAIMRKPMMEAGIRCIIAMLIGAMVIFAASSIPMYFVHKVEQRRGEDMRQQQYEQFKENYGLGND